MDIGDLKNTIAGYLETTAAAMVINGVDLCLLALNNARRSAELAHDFYYSQTNIPISITSSGGSIASANGPLSSVNITGTLSPNVVGNYPVIGQYDGKQLYAQVFAGATWFLYYNQTAGSYYLSNTIVEGDNTVGWSNGTTGTNPAGTYASLQNPPFTGVPVVVGEPSIAGIKRIQNVLLPLASGDLVPIEFLTNDEWLARVQRLVGRQSWNAGQTLYQLGVAANNGTCYQQGQMLFLVPASQFSFPVTATLSCVQWLPDYVLTTDTDFFTQFGPEYLQWQGIIEGNKLLKTFVQRREGNLDETNLQSESDFALQALIAWDNNIRDGTSTPFVPPPAAPQPAAQ